MRVSPKDLYTLRRAKLFAERRALEAQLAQNQAQTLLLEMERKYGLLGGNFTLDVATGRITSITKAKESA